MHPKLLHKVIFDQSNLLLVQIFPERYQEKVKTATWENNEEFIASISTWLYAWCIQKS